MRHERLQLGWSVVKLGREVGVSHQTIVRTELGQTEPDKTTWIRLAQVLKSDFGIGWLKAYIPVEKEVSIPITAKVAAGDAVEFFLKGEDEDSITVDARMIRKRGDHFALRVTGNSMTGAAVLTGDIIIVRNVPKTYKPGPNELIVADIVGEGITLKRWREKGNERVLLPSTEGYPEIKRPAHRIKPVAVLVGVIRIVE